MALDLLKPVVEISLPPRITYEPILNDYQSAMRDLLDRDGFTFELDDDLRGWVKFVANGPRNTGVNPLFDPDQTDHDDAFWLALKQDGKTVAAIASRYIECIGCGYYDIVREGRLFSRPPCEPLSILIGGPGASGRTCHNGGQYIVPEYRKLGLSWWLPNYLRSVSIQIWNLSSAYSMVMDGVKRAGHAHLNYGAQRVLPMIDGYFEPTGQHERIWSMEFDIPALVARMRNEALTIRSDGNKKMRDMAPMSRGEHRKH